MMAEQLSGVTGVIFIACGVLTFVLLFIFAKRQIMRFALRSRRGPHIQIGLGAKKPLRKEIERRLDHIPGIVYEPKLLRDTAVPLTSTGQSRNSLPRAYYRMKAVDDVKILEKEILKYDSTLSRHPGDSLRGFLVGLLGGTQHGVEQRVVHEFCDFYDHARFDPNEFGLEEYKEYSKLLDKLFEIIHSSISILCSKITTPGRTQTRRDIKRTQQKTTSEDSAIEQDRSMTSTVEDNGGVPESEQSNDVSALPRPNSLEVNKKADEGEGNN